MLAGPSLHAYADETNDIETLELVLPVFPPFQYLEDGQMKGFKLDLLREASHRAGYKLNIQFRPWARVLRMLENGDADFSNMYHNPEREKIYTFSKSVLFPITVQFFKRRDSDIKFDGNLASLEEYSIGVVNKFSYGKKFDMARKDKILKNIHPANNHLNLVSQLAGKRVELIVGSSYVLDNVIEKTGNKSKIIAISPPLSDANVYNAFTKKRDMTMVSKRMDDALLSMKKDGTFSRIILNAFAPSIASNKVSPTDPQSTN